MFYGCLCQRPPILAKALDYFHQSLRLGQLLGDPTREGGELVWMAVVERDLGHLTQAQALFEQSQRILEPLRLKFGSAGLRAINYVGNYDHYVDVLMRRHWQEPAAGFDVAALQASERGRARGLLELLAEARADLRQGVDTALFEQQDALRQQLAVKAAEQNKLSGQPANGAQATQLANQLADLKPTSSELKHKSSPKAPATRC
jgi:hypothetical protein